MAILQIRTDGDPILHKKSREVEVFDEKLKRTIDDMYETMYDAEGVGLAAVQVGKLKRLIVIDDYEGTKIVLINPEVLEEAGESEALEGCLSVPERVGKVKRFETIKIKYRDPEGEEKTLEAEGFLARIIQHEMDHLEGILYTDIAEEMYTVNDREEAESEA
ncbi:MAG: peptide deformylase [Peptoniphilus sp.]|nr:peptide deformylase [Peptoniphilus sp.]MDD7362941.1 peptide deformylase [Bacillota bacterium]MDY6044181.1 peptide deformylase [Peptoniphilus sp.]